MANRAEGLGKFLHSLEAQGFVKINGSIGGSKNGGTTIAAWFVRENLVGMDDLRVPPILENLQMTFFSYSDLLVYGHLEEHPTFFVGHSQLPSMWSSSKLCSGDGDFYIGPVRSVLVWRCWLKIMGNPQFMDDLRFRFFFLLFGRWFLLADVANDCWRRGTCEGYVHILSMQLPPEMRSSRQCIKREMMMIPIETMNQ